MELIDKYVPEYINMLTGKVPINFENYFLLLTEDNINISANPFVASLIAFYLKNNINVILISSQEPLHHYSTVCKKFVRKYLIL